MTREFLEQTRYLRTRPEREWGQLLGKVPQRRSWLEILGGVACGVILLIGIVMAT